MDRSLNRVAAASIISVAVALVVAAQGQTYPSREGFAADQGGIGVGVFNVNVIASGERLEEHRARGRFYVKALEGAEYELRIVNPLPARVAVALSVDGLNTIDARRTTAWGASKWVIEPYGTITVRGWQMSSARARRFYFTTERDSYAAGLGRASDLGVISAVFFRERQPLVVKMPSPRGVEDDDGRQRSSRRAPSAAGSSNSNEAARAGIYSTWPDDASAATGIGRSVRNDVRRTSMNLDPRAVASVTIRYEYRAALVRLGILPRAVTNADVLRRRERATGFENGYCPEP